MFKKIRSYLAVFAAFMFMLAVNSAQAAYDIVTVSTNGDISFSPENLVTPVIAMIGSAAGVVAGGILLIRGIRWVFKLVGWVR